MREEVHHRTLNHRLARLLRTQHGVVCRRQLLALGLSPAAIGRRLDSGSLLAVGRGAYTAGHERLTPLGIWMRAVLLGGQGAMLSHRSAGELRGICRSILPLAEITIPRGRSCRGHRNLLVHRGPIPESDRRRRQGIPVTSLQRTYLDLAGVLAPRPIERLIAEAHPSTTRGLREYARGHRGRAGAGRLIRALDRAEAGSTATQNEFEELLFALCRSHGLPDPVCQLSIGPYRVDFAWPDAGLVVETDGQATHLTAEAFEADRERDTELDAMGWDVRRFTWRQLHDRPDWVAVKLAELVTRSPVPARRRRRPRP